MADIQVKGGPVLPGAGQRQDQRPEQREEPRRRLLKGDDHNPFEIEPTLIPDGQSWEWKAKTIMGWEDREAQIRERMNGWLPVPARVYYQRTPQIMQQLGIGPDDPVVVGGQMLMERPVALTREAMAEDKARADAQYNEKMAQLSASPPGTMQRTSALVRRSHGNTLEVSDK